MRRLMPLFVCVALFLSCASVEPKVEKGAPMDFVCLDCATISPKDGKCPFCGKEMASMEKMTVCPECTMPAKGFCPHCRVETVPGFTECVCDGCGKKCSTCECPPPAEKPGEMPKFTCPKCAGPVKFSKTECICPRCAQNFPFYKCMPPCGKCKSCGAPMRMRTLPMRFMCA